MTHTAYNYKLILLGLAILFGLGPSLSTAQFESKDISYVLAEKTNGAWSDVTTCTLRFGEGEAWFSKDSTRECTWIDQTNFEQKLLIEFQGLKAAVAPDRTEEQALNVNWTGEEKKVLGYTCQQLLVEWSNLKMEAWVYPDTKLGYLPYLNRSGIALEYTLISEGSFENRYLATSVQKKQDELQGWSAIDEYELMTIQQMNVKLMDIMMPKLSHAPSFEHMDLQGQALGIDGKPERLLVVNFWYTQCPPCIKEIPSLNAMKHKYAEADVDFWAITFDDVELVNSFLNSHPFDYRIVPEASKVIADFNISVYPTNMIITPNGEIFKSFLGGDENTMKELDAFIQQALHLQHDGKSK